MIVVEKYINEIDGREFKKTYSSENFLIRKIGTNEIYEEAIDLPNAVFEYEETNNKIIEVEVVE